MSCTSSRAEQTRRTFSVGTSPHWGWAEENQLEGVTTLAFPLTEAMLALADLWAPDKVYNVSGASAPLDS